MLPFVTMGQLSSLNGEEEERDENFCINKVFLIVKGMEDVKKAVEWKETLINHASAASA